MDRYLLPAAREDLARKMVSFGGFALGIEAGDPAGEEDDEDEDPEAQTVFLHVAVQRL